MVVDGRHVVEERRPKFRRVLRTCVLVEQPPLAELLRNPAVQCNFTVRLPGLMSAQLNATLDPLVQSANFTFDLVEALLLLARPLSGRVALLCFLIRRCSDGAKLLQ